MIKRIKRRREGEMMGAPSEVNIDLPPQTNKGVKKKNIKKTTDELCKLDCTTEKNEVKKETKVYQTKRLKQKESQSTCTDIVLSPPLNTSIMAAPIAEPEEYVTHFLESKKHLSTFTYAVNDRVCVYKDIEKPLKSKETSSVLIDCYIEIIKARYELSKKSGIHFMDSVSNFMWWYKFTQWKCFDMDVSTWDVDIVQNFPQQIEESVDCRVFMMKAMEDLALDNPINFTKDHIPAIIRRMVSDIIRLSKRTYSRRFK